MSKAKATPSPNSSTTSNNFISAFGNLSGDNSFITAAQVLAAAQNNGTATSTSASQWGQPSSSEPQTNFPFDPRIRRIAANGLFSSGAFTRNVKIGSGSMATIGPDGKTYACIFQFNPTEIDMSYGFDSTVSAVLNPSFVAAGAGAQSSQGLMLNNSISFTLLFDRTYEVWTGTHFNKTAFYSQQQAVLAGLNLTPQFDPIVKNVDVHALGGVIASKQSAQLAAISKEASSMGPYKFGVMWDVWAVERLAGIFGQYNGMPPNGPPAAGITQVKFGPDSTGGPLSSTTTLGGGYAFGFTGWMTAMEVQYTRFDASMVPTRCSIGLTFEQIYSLQAASTNQDLVVGANGAVQTSGGG